MHDIPRVFLFFIEQLFLIFNQMLSSRAFGRREYRTPVSVMLAEGQGHNFNLGTSSLEGYLFNNDNIPTSVKENVQHTYPPWLFNFTIKYQVLNADLLTFFSTGNHA